MAVGVFSHPSCPSSPPPSLCRCLGLCTTRRGFHDPTREGGIPFPEMFFETFLLLSIAFLFCLPRSTSGSSSIPLQMSAPERTSLPPSSRVTSSSVTAAATGYTGTLASPISRVSPWRAGHVPSLSDYLRTCHSSCHWQSRPYLHCRRRRAAGAGRHLLSLGDG